jgi:hypothetical protein
MLITTGYRYQANKFLWHKVDKMKVEMGYISLLHFNCVGRDCLK